MTVPEASLSEENGPKTRECQVWFTWEVGPVELKAKTTGM